MFKQLTGKQKGETEEGKTKGTNGK